MIKSSIAAFTMAVAVLLATLGGYAVAADEVTIKELISDMPAYDGKMVTITGEAVGDVMMRDGNGWVTVNDDVYATRSIEEGGRFSGSSNIGIAVWATREELGQIEVLGGYKNKGDRVRVTGVFHRTCPEHGGDTDIHASSLEVLKPGYPFSHHLAWWKLALVIALSAAALVLGWMWRKRATSQLSPTGRR